MTDSSDGEVEIAGHLGRFNLLWLVLIALPGLLPVLMGMTGGGLGLAVRMLPGTMFYSGLIAVFLWLRKPWARFVPATLGTNRGSLHVNDRLAVAKESIVDGLLAPQPTGEPRVVLRRRGVLPDVVMRVPSVDAGLSLLHALGVDASQRRTRFRVASPLMNHQVKFGLGLMATFILSGALIARTALALRTPLVAMLPVVALFVMGYMPSRLEVGADGLWLSWLGRRRFIPLSRILRVEEYVTGRTPFRKPYVGIRLAIRGAEPVDLPVAQKMWDGGRAAMIVERVREALASRQHAGPPVDTALLRRDSRAMKDWMAALRAMGAGTDSFRTTAFGPERLLRVVEDPTADATVRAAAAVAVGAQLDDERRARLRVVAGSVASPKVRVVIERAAEGAPDDEVEAALAEVARTAE